MEPDLPPDWPGYEAVWRLPGGRLEICVERTGTWSAALDGGRVEGGVPLKGLTGGHRLEVTI